MPAALAHDQFAALFGNRRGATAQVTQESGLSEEILLALGARPSPREAPSEGLEIRQGLQLWCHQRPRDEADPPILLSCFGPMGITNGKTEGSLSEWLAWFMGEEDKVTLPLEWGQVIVRSKKGELERTRAWLHAQWYWRFHFLEGISPCPVALSLSSNPDPFADPFTES